MNAVYDATSRETWLSYAEKNEFAYRRPYVQVNLMDFIPYNSANPEVKVEKINPCARARQRFLVSEPAFALSLTLRG